MKRIKKTVTKQKVAKLVVDEHAGGASLDDAFADDDDVAYGKAKPAKIKKAQLEDELDEELDEIERKVGGLSDDSRPEVHAGKPIAQVKKGDRIIIDGQQLEVDQHYVLIDHDSTKEMALEVFNPTTEIEYQIRYFADQVEATLELYQLQEIMYLKKSMKSISW